MGGWNGTRRKLCRRRKDAIEDVGIEMGWGEVGIRGL